MKMAATFTLLAIVIEPAISHARQGYYGDVVGYIGLAVVTFVGIWSLNEGMARTQRKKRHAQSSVADRRALRYHRLVNYGGHRCC